jgi:hypothetical protein
MKITPPRVTVYSRIIDNITGEQIEGYKLVNRKSNFHFGRINGISGGESSVIIEFDIWNNEPAIMAGMGTHGVQDATECKFTAWDNNSLTSSKNIEDHSSFVPYVHARSVTQFQDDFQPIGGTRYLPSEKIYNSVSNIPGFISGQPGGDHTKIQTKIVLPINQKPEHKNFVFEFSFNYM